MANYAGTTTLYSGRTLDLLLLDFVPCPVADAAVSLDVSSTPRIVSGIEKMAQRFAHIFLTDIGSVGNMESEGTSFMTLLRTGRIYDLATLKSAVAVANRSTLRQMKAADVDLTTPDDEAIENSEVLDATVNRKTATVSVTIKLTTRSGDTYTYVTPIATGL